MVQSSVWFKRRF